jgi:hypothetical protein
MDATPIAGAIDPVFSLLGSLALAVLFASSSYHKALDLSRFEWVLANYQLLPSVLVGPAASLMTAIEIGVSAALLFPASRKSAATTAAALLLAYSLAIGINLLRGRTEIDCGCGGDTEQPIGPGLLLRNALLICVAIVTIQPATPRPLFLLDAFTVLVSLATLAVLWQAAGLLHGTRRSQIDVDPSPVLARLEFPLAPSLAPLLAPFRRLRRNPR